MRIPTKDEMMSGLRDHSPECTLFYQTNLGGIEAKLSGLTTVPTVTFRATRTADDKRVTLDFTSYSAAVDFLLGL